MKVIIDIPKEFEDDIKDNFQDFFERVKVEIAHRVNTDDTLLCGNYERETAEMLLEAFNNMSVIPKVITNGDMIKALFPNMNIQERNNVTLDIKVQTIEFTGMALKEWWNAPYDVAENE
jgi:stalled ribosome rescue protein Dom34